MKISNNQIMQWQQDLWSDLEKVISSYLDESDEQKDLCKVIDITQWSKIERLKQSTNVGNK